MVLPLPVDGFEQEEPFEGPHPLRADQVFLPNVFLLDFFVENVLPSDSWVTMLLRG